MALYKIPPNIGKVRLAMGTSGTYAVWNGKQGQHEFRILCRTRKQAEDAVKVINSKQHSGEIEILS